MAFFAIALALCLQHVRPLPLKNPISLAFHRLATESAKQLAAGSRWQGWLAWGVAAVLPAVMVATVFILLSALGGTMGMLWSIAVLYVCLGFGPLNNPAIAVRDALANQDSDKARDVLANWQGNSASAVTDEPAVVKHTLETAVLQAHHQLFGVIVAYVIGAMLGFGPALAVLLRGAQYVASLWQAQRSKPDSDVSIELAYQAQAAWNWINWLPARVTAAGLALAGNFEQARNNWDNATQQPAGIASTDSDAIMAATAMGAISLPWPLPPSEPLALLPAPNQPNDAGTVQPAPVVQDTVKLQHLQSFIGLVQRCTLIVLAALAVVSFTTWWG